MEPKSQIRSHKSEYRIQKYEPPNSERRTRIYAMSIEQTSPASEFRLQSRADAEGPVHRAARHVRNAAVETGDTLSNVARTAGRTIYHRTRPVREAFEYPVIGDYQRSCSERLRPWSVGGRVRSPSGPSRAPNCLSRILEKMNTRNLSLTRPPSRRAAALASTQAE